MTTPAPSRHIVASVVLMAVVFILFIPSLHYGYLLEDYMYLRSYNLPEIIITFYSHWEPTLIETKGYRPFHSVHYAVFHCLIGGTPVGNHILQAVLLAISVLILYRLTLLLTENQWAAFWTAFIYPCLGMTAWQISFLNHRHHIIQVIFFLLCILYYHRYLFTRSTLSWAFSLLYFLGALLIKEGAVVLPFILLFYALFVSKRSLRSQLRPLIPFFVLLTGYLIIRTIIVKSMPEESAFPPPRSYSPIELVYDYSRSLLATIVQSQGIRDPNNDFPMYTTSYVNLRDYIGLFSAAGFFILAGIIFIRKGNIHIKRIFLFGLVILISSNILVAAWYRSNRLFLSCIGLSLMGGILLASVFKYLSARKSLPSYLMGGLALGFFSIYLTVNLVVFFEIQYALRPEGFLATTWDRWAYENYIPWMKKEQMFIFDEKLRRTGRGDWADKLPLNHTDKP